MWSFDATPLIYLAKVDRLSLVRDLPGRCVIPERVFEEVVDVGIEEGYPDARRIERSVEADRFDVVTVESSPLFTRLQRNDSLSDADVAVLVCAEGTDGVAVIDETYGRDVAAAEGITTRGTAYIVLRCVKDGALGAEDGRSVIDSMIEKGWYCSPAVYAKIVAKLDSLSD
jgi:predicted nucleic acid-binding protein